MSKMTKKEQRDRRHRRLRVKLSGTAESPRLSVSRSGKHLYAPVINDVLGETLVSGMTTEGVCREQKLSANVKSAEVVGKLVAERAMEKGIRKVVFDRGGFPYHGCVKALADAARAAGLEV